jgi:hypothetical protein
MRTNSEEYKGGFSWVSKAPQWVFWDAEAFRKQENQGKILGP